KAPCGSAHATPGMAASSSCIRRRRPSNAARIVAVDWREPVRAATAAAWEELETFDVVCDWRFVAAAATSGGAMSHPTRHPVMAYALDTALITTQRSASSGTTTGIEG